MSCLIPVHTLHLHNIMENMEHFRMSWSVIGEVVQHLQMWRRCLIQWHFFCICPLNFFETLETEISGSLVVHLVWTSAKWSLCTEALILGNLTFIIDLFIYFFPSTVKWGRKKLNVGIWPALNSTETTHRHSVQMMWALLATDHKRPRQFSIALP